MEFIECISPTTLCSFSCTWHYILTKLAHAGNGSGHSLPQMSLTLMFLNELQEKLTLQWVLPLILWHSLYQVNRIWCKVKYVTVFIFFPVWKKKSGCSSRQLQKGCKESEILISWSSSSHCYKTAVFVHLLVDNGPHL